MALRPLGHIGFWAGVYVGASFVFVAQMSGLSPGLPPWEALLAVVLIATAAYSIDRVKLAGRWLDPADAEAQPERFAFLRPRARVVRTLAFLMLVAGSVLGLRFTPWSLLVAPAVIAGVAAYAPRPRGTGARLKDRIWLKNAYVGAGITVFAAAAALVVAQSRQGRPLRELVEVRGSALAVAVSLLFLRVVLDAALCDIDDEPTDRRFGTATFATLLGGPRLWAWSLFARAALTVAVVLAMPCPLPFRIGWGGAMALGTLALRARPPSRIRDWIDARFLAEAALATVIALTLQRLRS